MKQVVEKLRRQQAECAQKAYQHDREAELLRREESAIRLAADTVEDELRKQEQDKAED